MAGVSLDAASSEDLCLGEPGLFVGLILKNLDVSLGLNDGVTSGDKGFVLKKKRQNQAPPVKVLTYTHSFPLGEFSSMNLSTGGIEGRVSYPGTSKESSAGASGAGSSSNGVIAASAVGNVTDGGGVAPAREEASSASASGR